MKFLELYSVPGEGLIAAFEELGDTLLVCATETRSDADIAMYADHLARVIKTQTAAGCPVKPKMA